MPEGDCKADVEVAATIKDGVAEGMVELSLHEYWLDIPTASNELSHLFIPNVANDRYSRLQRTNLVPLVRKLD